MTKFKVGDEVIVCGHKGVIYNIIISAVIAYEVMIDNKVYAFNEAVISKIKD